MSKPLLLIFPPHLEQPHRLLEAVGVQKHIRSDLESDSDVASIEVRTDVLFVPHSFTCLRIARVGAKIDS